MRAKFEPSRKRSGSQDGGTSVELKGSHHATQIRAVLEAIPDVNAPLKLFYHSTAGKLASMAPEGEAQACFPIDSPEQFANALELVAGIHFVKFTEDGDEPANLCPTVAKRIIALPRYQVASAFPEVRQFVTHPIVASDRTLIQTPGLHRINLWKADQHRLGGEALGAVLPLMDPEQASAELLRYVLEGQKLAAELERSRPGPE